VFVRLRLAELILIGQYGIPEGKNELVHLIYMSDHTTVVKVHFSVVIFVILDLLIDGA
jgi:hypothetical protein